MPWLYALTLFVGAVLLFAVQPMMGRMLLPTLGGSPAVWNSCLVFFQGMLLLGYLYSHLTTRHLGLRRQSLLHLVFLAAVVLALPIAVKRNEPPAEGPAIWLLATLLISVGIPFLAVSTTSPLLQRWYAGTRARGASDPYFLSMASNFGCFVALLAYPIVIEPTLRLSVQSDWWRWAYVIYIGLTVICAGGLWTMGAMPTALRGHNSEPPSPNMPTQSGGHGTHETAPASRRDTPIRWLILAFIPSSLLVGVTNAITTDIAPIPLLWIMPLSIYLLTFIIAFAPRLRLPLGSLGKGMAMSVLFLGLAIMMGATEPLWIVLALHLSAFALVAMVCHGRLATERPNADRLTGFYLWMSLGGVLGGAFNALAAPVLFHRVGYVEYPLIMIAATMLRPMPIDSWRFRIGDVVAPAILGAFVVGLIFLTKTAFAARWLAEIGEMIGMNADIVRRATCFGLPLILTFLFVERPIRFALGLGALFLASALDLGSVGRVLYVERNFLGVVKVTQSSDGQFTRMVHGNTVHGQQRQSPRPQYVAAFALPLGATSPLNELSILAAVDGRWDDRRKPLTYYHPTGPAGITFRYLVDGWQGPRRIGAVGLGTGAIASYARPNQDWTFFELDPAVERLARDDRYFTYLHDSRAQSLNVVIGDARMRLATEPDASFDLLVLDAFSSDAIPIHLLTVEAFALYERKLAPNGVILIHLSNRYLDLPPVVAKIAESANTPLIVRQNDDLGISDREQEDGKYPSIWVVVARRDEDFGPLQRAIRGFLPVNSTSAPLWTDDRADVLGAFRKSDD